MDNYIQILSGSVAVALTGAAVATAAYIASRPKPLEPNVDLDHQSDEQPGPDNIRVSRISPNGKQVAYLHEDAQTLYECMLRGLRESENGPCMGSRIGKKKTYEWISYSQVIDKARNFGSGLIYMGMKPGSTTFVGIYSQNSPECIIAEEACYSQSMVIVPLYDTLGPHACTLIINEAEINTVVCDKEEKVLALLAEKSQTPNLKLIVVVDEVSEETQKSAKNCDVKILYFHEVEEIGKRNPQDTLPPKPTCLATVCYTSGTTGSPKGVMLTHGNVVANICAVMYQLGSSIVTKHDIMLSFLPLAHMFERCCQMAVYMVGGRVGFFQGNIRLLSDDMKALKPTIMPCVPRILNRIYDKVQEGAKSSPLKQYLLNAAIESKKAELKNHIIRNNGFWDWLVFKPVRENLGGQLRLIVVGSAPLAGHVLDFLRCALGCVIVEGYGQTECVAPCTLTVPCDTTVDHVGPPLPCCSVKLTDVPEMKYFSSEGKGEVCVKGNSVFQGYLKDTEKTTAVLDNDGWLHTGDIGMWLPNGTLKILDRKKHIFKLAQGEYVAPEKIENIYLRSACVSQVFVHGESLKACLVGIVVPAKDVILAWTKENGIEGDWVDICENKEVRKHILEDMVSLGRKAGLKSFEQVKDIVLYPKMFTVENGLLTPTLKTKRPECREYFATQIEAMYRCLT